MTATIGSLAHGSAFASKFAELPGILRAGHDHGRYRQRASAPSNNGIGTAHKPITPPRDAREASKLAHVFLDLDQIERGKHARSFSGEDVFNRSA
ncbi:MAG: hypothetical protein AAGJ94_07295 [Pseudomonadota bacterium]